MAAKPASAIPRNCTGMRTQRMPVQSRTTPKESIQMKLKPLGANRTELTLASGAVVFFSYQTPVAAQRAEGGFIRTAQHYSVTTLRHIDQWLEGRNAQTVPQAEINSIAGV
jgi:hypothetical protein